MKTVCSQAREYLVAAGDTIERVAQRFEVPTGQLAAVNRVDPVGPLSEGSRLVIPCAPSVASAPTLAVIAEATPNSSAIVPQTIGFSALGLPLEVYRLGNGSARIVFVGGIHGGYEWNTVLLAYSVLDYLTANPASIPPNTTVEIVPAANPDGVVEVVGHPGRFSVAEVAADTRPGRFNGNGV
ncbi:MAG: LysM peptidoglycan-binding domain-containing protein, partial [Caldilineaceae bacterium]|nr:LysM peptidoglycan-binding domain-containing protein [Caldilineaceae bacterium]